MDNNYQRQKAVNYALRYGMNPNPEYRYFKLIGNNGGDCSNFISQCLFNGGAPMAYSNQQWWYKSGGGNGYNDAWSVSWAVAHSLYWTLKIRGQQRDSGLSGLEVNDIKLLELGDIIQIEADNTVFHSAIVTGFSGGMPLITQHTFNAVNIPLSATYQGKRHYIKIMVRG